MNPTDGSIGAKGPAFLKSRGDITCMWNLKIITTQMSLRIKQTPRLRKQIYGHQRGAVGGGLNEGSGINKYTLLCTEQTGRTHCVAQGTLLNIL